MSRFFNTAGPVNPEDHHCLPPLARVSLDHVRRLIDQEKYFVLHAPRQTGKTSCFLAIRDALNREGKYFCVYANVEMAQGACESVQEGLSLILQEIADRQRRRPDRTRVRARPRPRRTSSSSTGIRRVEEWQGRPITVWGM